MRRVMGGAQRVGPAPRTPAPLPVPMRTHHCHEELLDALQRELIALYQHPHWVGHELVGHLQHLVWEGGAHQHHLHGRSRAPGGRGGWG
jgi:hypothetical protein